MRHGKRGRKLGRTASHRKAMLSNLATSLFQHGAVRTTLPKAKELRSVAERLITFAKRGDLHARRQVLRRIQNKVVVTKLFDEIGPSFTDRQGGYTRVLKIGPRRGDSSELCLVELVGEERRADYADTTSTPVFEKAEAPVVETEEQVDVAEVEEEDASEAEEADEAVPEETETEADADKADDVDAVDKQDDQEKKDT